MPVSHEAFSNIARMVYKEGLKDTYGDESAEAIANAMVRDYEREQVVQQGIMPYTPPPTGDLPQLEPYPDQPVVERKSFVNTPLLIGTGILAAIILLSK